MIIKSLIIFLINTYRYLISPLFPVTCRFYPSCSAYARESFATHTLPRATLLTAKRLLKCHPYHPGGLDPVPPLEKKA